MAGHLELFCESELMLAEGRNLDVITSARLQSHPEVTASYDKMRLAYLMAEMVNRLSGDESAQSDAGPSSKNSDSLFQLLHDSYLSLEESADAVLELWFKLRLLDRLGYRPGLGACMVCGRSEAANQHRFNVELGGIVDESCATPASQPITNEQIKFWRLVLEAPMSTMRRVEAATALAQTTMPLCNLFYDHLFGQRFRSAEVLA
jgi:DNA repair protein RecO (recombination protein O)